LKKFFFHPFLFALYPVFSLYARNIDRAPLSQAARVVLILLLAAVLLLTVLRLVTHSWQRAAIITSLFLVLFSSYGHVYNVLAGRHFLGLQLGRADTLAALYAASFIFLGWFTWRKLKDPAAASSILNIVSIALISFPLISALAFAPVLLAGDHPLPACGPEPQPPAAGLHRPDIYYIILDEYGRSDMLKQVIDFDNSAFVAQLEARGFYVTGESYSNYAITHMSLASSLNSCYLNEYVSIQPGDEPANTKLLTNSIRNSSARRYLEQAGYRFITFATGYPPSDIAGASLFIKPASYLNALELEFIRGSVLAIFFDPIRGYQARTVIQNAFDQLASLPQNDPDTPKFVFAHIQTNHAPFVFGPNGEALPPWGFSPAEMPGAPPRDPSRRSYAAAYQDQAEYANQLILRAVDEILRNSQTEPVIILQGDHGTQVNLDWNSVENTCVKERHAILNAYYFPGQDFSQLYPQVSPVNTFRLLFNQYFGSDLPLYEDRAYFSEWDRSYDYLDVTGKMEDCD